VPLDIATQSRSDQPLVNNPHCDFPEIILEAQLQPSHRNGVVGTCSLRAEAAPPPALHNLARAAGSNAVFAKMNCRAGGLLSEDCAPIIFPVEFESIPTFPKRSIMSTAKKVAIVTGASQGIGAEIVKAYRKLGYRVLATSRSIKPSDDAEVITVAGDIGDRSTAQRVVAEALARFGRIDTLVNNAGIFIGKPFTEHTVEDYNAIMNVNMAGFFHITQLALARSKSSKAAMSSPSPAASTMA
jgi:hypothetical protein